MSQCTDHHWYSWAWPELQKHWGKFYQGNGYAYMQSNVNEQLKMRSNQYGQIYDVKNNDIFVIDFQAKADSQVTLELIKEGVIQSSIEVVPNGNSNFNRQTQYIIAPGDAQFDQLQFSGGVNDKDYLKCYDIRLLCGPDPPSNPSPPDGAVSVGLSPILSVDVYDRNGDSMDVSFYNASDSSLIGTDSSIPSGGTASVTWENLLTSTTYSWYAIANDGGVATTSPTWSFTTNYASNAPFNPSPANGATGIELNPVLSVDVVDLDGDLMDVHFYNASDDSLIGSEFGVSSGSTASVSWFGLTEGAVYSWYAIADDGLSLNASQIWSFTTNFVPYAPFNPSPADGATGISTNPLLSVAILDPNGDLMDISFYNASDDSLIGTDFGVFSGGTASVSWFGLAEGAVYSWYVIAHDGVFSNISSTWTFTTNNAPNLLTNPLPVDGAIEINLNPILSVDVYDPDGDTMDVSFYNASDDSLIGTDFGVSSGGIASISWSSLSDGKLYNWYAVADDGVSTATSSIWSFTTNYAPFTPSNPSPVDGATGLDFNLMLGVDLFDPDGDPIDVSFYNASDDSLIGTNFGVSSGGTASVAWSSLSEGAIYNWYAVADDGNSMTSSLT